MSLRDELASIYEVQGKLTPKLVVDAARAKSHPLHDRFEWDNRVAGEKYRQHQAAELIRSIKVEWVSEEPTTEGDRVRKYHSVTRADVTSYEPVEVVMADEFMRAVVIKQAEREWKQMYARYQHLSEFLQIVRLDVAS